MNPFIIFTGTDPSTSVGGIGVVMNGYIGAMEQASMEYTCIPTYEPPSFYGKHVLWLTRIPALISAIWKKKRENGKVVVYSHVGSGGSLSREFFIQCIARLCGAGTVHHSHAPQAEHYLNNSLVKPFIKLALLPSEKVVVLTEFWKRFFKGHGFKNDFHVVHNPLPPDLLVASQNERVHEEKPVLTVLAIARLAKGKGVDVAIRAVSKISDGVRLLVAGDGELREELMALTRELGAEDRVEFLGWVSGQQKTQLFETVDAFCLPSTNDAYPMSFVESMSYGLPVVGIKYAGIPDIVVDGENGFLVDGENSDEVAAALVKLKDAALRNEMGRSGQKRIANISSPHKVAESIRKVLQA